MKSIKNNSIERYTLLLGVLLALTCGPVLIGTLGAAEKPQAKKPKRPAPPAKMKVDRKAKPLRISFISYANPKHVAGNIQQVVKYLEPYLGVPVEGYSTPDYGSSIETMRSGKSDMAFVDPLAFMMAHEQIGAQPVVLEVYGGGKPTYHSCIWVRKDSPFKTVEDLKGKTIAFADQVDMSGHLLPRDIFVQKKLLPPNRLEGAYFKQVYFAGGDEQAVRAVLNKFVDSAGISQYAYLLLRPEERDQMRILARSIDSPSHLLMARKGLDPKLVARIRQTLLALDASKAADKAILARLYGVEGYAPAKLGDFAKVAKVAGRYGFFKKPQLFQMKAVESGKKK